VAASNSARRAFNSLRACSTLSNASRIGVSSLRSSRKQSSECPSGSDSVGSTSSCFPCRSLTASCNAFSPTDGPAFAVTRTRAQAYPSRKPYNQQSTCSPSPPTRDTPKGFTAIPSGNSERRTSRSSSFGMTASGGCSPIGKDRSAMTISACPFARCLSSIVMSKIIERKMRWGQGNYGSATVAWLVFSTAWQDGPGRQYKSKYEQPTSPQRGKPTSRSHCSFAYSALASFRTGMPGSASFQSVRKSL
jgi:hypothetical protein